MAKVYLAKVLWHRISTYADACRCVTCGGAADYVQAAVTSAGPSGRFAGHFTRAEEQRILAEHGRLLRLSGSKGRMFELAGGALECELDSGERLRPCCWLEGGRLVESRSHGMLAAGHNVGCPNHVSIGH